MRPTPTDALELLYGDVAVPVPLESIRISALFYRGHGIDGSALVNWKG